MSIRFVLASCSQIPNAQSAYIPESCYSSKKNWGLAPKILDMHQPRKSCPLNVILFWVLVHYCKGLLFQRPTILKVRVRFRVSRSSRVRARDIPDFGSGSGTSGIRPF